MKISEQDIFNYIFFRDKLSVETIRFIEENTVFNDEISFYSSMKNSLSASDKKVYILKPVTLNFKRYNSTPRYAAASADLTRKTEFTTFTDEQSGYLCRFIKSDNKNLLYIISADERTDKKLDITIFPSETTYHLDNIKDPLHLPEIEVELIHLEEQG
jgi:hypothetical protein